MSLTPERISQRQLRNDSGAILRAVRDGAVFIVTNNGQPVAEIRPIQSDPLAGLKVKRAKQGASFRDITPHKGRSDETALESLLFLRGDR